MLPFASDKAKLLAKNFYKNSNLDGLYISSLAFPFRANMKQHVSVTPKTVKKVITNLHSSKGSGPDCFPVLVLKNLAQGISQKGKRLCIFYELGNKMQCGVWETQLQIWIQ